MINPIILDSVKFVNDWNYCEFCNFCKNIFVGRNQKDAGIAKCGICGCNSCKSCLDNNFQTWESGFQCKECDDKMNLLMEEEESDEQFNQRS